MTQESGAGILTPSIAEETLVLSNNNGTKVPAQRDIGRSKPG